MLLSVDEAYSRRQSAMTTGTLTDLLKRRNAVTGQVIVEYDGHLNKAVSSYRPAAYVCLALHAISLLSLLLKAGRVELINDDSG